MNRIRSQFERLFSRRVLVPTEQTIMLKQISEGFFVPENGAKSGGKAAALLEHRRDSLAQLQTLTILLGDVRIDQLQQNVHHRSVNCVTCKQALNELTAAYTETGITMCAQTAQKLISLNRDIAREKLDVESVLLETTKEDVLRLMRRSFLGLQEVFPSVSQLTIVFGSGIDEVIPNLVSAFSGQISSLRIATPTSCITESLAKAIASVANLQHISFIVGHFQIDDSALACFSQIKSLEIFCLCSNINDGFLQMISTLESKNELTKIVFHQDKPIREPLQMPEILKGHFIEYPTSTNNNFEPCSKTTFCPLYFNNNENSNQEKKELLKPYCYVLLPILFITMSIVVLSIIRYIIL